MRSCFGRESCRASRSCRALLPVCAALIASISWAFFMEPLPEIPMPPAIAFRSARSMELSPPERFLEAAAAAGASGAVVVESMVSVT